MMYSYKLPGLNNYRFNKEGECRRVNGIGDRQIKLLGNSYYTLINDQGEREYVKLTEILQYIKHIDYLRSLLTYDNSN